MYSIYIACCVLLGLLFWILDLAYPRPYAGIPYSKQAAKRLLGDVPDFVKFIQSGQDPAHFGIAQCRKLNSPLIQVFLRPFSRPFIFLDDDREVEDILATRTKEFDRAPSTVGAFKPFFKHSSILKQTTSAWRAQRRLWADTMSTDFLRRVAAPKMHKYALELVELLKTKTAIARGRPFSVEEDFDLATFDIIWASVLGSDLNGVLNEHAGIQSGLDSVAQPESTDSPAVMPRVQRGQMFLAAEFFNMTMEQSLTSPLPTLQHWIWRQLPTYKRHWAVKEQIVNDLIKNARHRFAHFSEAQVSGHQDTCAMDLVLRRESLAIQKSTTSSTRTPPTTAEVHDELFMFLIAVRATQKTPSSSNTASNSEPGPRDNSNHINLVHQVPHQQPYSAEDASRSAPRRIPRVIPVAPPTRRGPHLRQDAVHGRHAGRMRPPGQHDPSPRARRHRRHPSPGLPHPQGHANHVQPLRGRGPLRHSRVAADPKVPGGQGQCRPRLGARHVALLPGAVARRRGTL